MEGAGLVGARRWVRGHGRAVRVKRVAVVLVLGATRGAVMEPREALASGTLTPRRRTKKHHKGREIIIIIIITTSLDQLFHVYLPASVSGRCVTALRVVV